MDNQKNKDEKKYNNSAIDLSKFLARKKGKITLHPKRFSLEIFKASWQRMEKKNQIFTITIIVSLILGIILLVTLFASRKTIPSQDVPPPAWEEYIPPNP